MKILYFKIPGTPIAKKRPRFARRGKHVVTYNDQETEEGKFLLQVLEQRPDWFTKPFERGLPLSLICYFEMSIPKSTSKKKQLLMQQREIPHTKKPDLDNLVKFVKDCLTGPVWHDDSQVCSLITDKYYSTEPKTVIIINVKGGTGNDHRISDYFKSK